MVEQREAPQVARPTKRQGYVTRRKQLHCNTKELVKVGRLAGSCQFTQLGAREQKRAGCIHAPQGHHVDDARRDGRPNPSCHVAAFAVRHVRPAILACECQCARTAGAWRHRPPLLLHKARGWEPHLDVHDEEEKACVRNVVHGVHGAAPEVLMEWSVDEAQVSTCIFNSLCLGPHIEARILLVRGDLVNIHSHRPRARHKHSSDVLLKVTHLPLPHQHSRPLMSLQQVA
mmetsp:Transcript_37687/g.100156  ORF Transcript_37687/g.100156 Transcript_37687/m.100156 type:complete len:230 (+) Transcript_37687:477-1166(+)